jgi:hypothetical protein
MKQKFKSRALIFFSIIFVLLLLLASCGSDSDSESPSDSNGSSDSDNSGDENSGDDNSGDDNSGDDNSGNTDFNGTWNIWEERGYLCGRVPPAETVQYGITIHQTGNQARLHLYNDDNQSLSCELDGDELVCQGTYTSGDGWSITYDEYRIGYIGTGDHTELIGSTEWTVSDSNGDCDGISDLTSVDPDDTDPDDTDPDDTDPDDTDPDDTDPDDTDPDDTDNTDFIGTWNIWEERGYLCVRVPPAETVQYNITIEQPGGRILLHLYNDTTQSLSCELDGDELVCNGSYTSREGWSIRYDEYRLYFTGVDRRNLNGNAEWIFSDGNVDNCSGTSSMSTVPAN